ncbi:MAG: transposase [Syntrophales bacterium]|nr:transposase [Syntrophales bacterium]
MPRSARLDAPGVVHHIIIRGIEHRNIFRDNQDRENLLERLGRLLLETRTVCYAWAFLPNHAHFLFRTGEISIATLMRRLLTGYVVSFNRRHKRHGHLLQNRYKSIVCQEEKYFQELVRYIHLNPLRAGIVSNLADLNSYFYCGHSTLMGKKECSWQDVDYVLHPFGKTVHSARRAYFSYVEAGLEQGRREDLIGGGLVRTLGGWAEAKKLRLKGLEHIKSDERILGDSDFVDSVLARANEYCTRQCELRRRGYSLEQIAKRVAEIYRMDVGEVLARGRQQQRVNARSLFCFWAVRELGISLADLARRLGMSPPGVGYAVQRGEAIAQENSYQLI